MANLLVIEVAIKPVDGSIDVVLSAPGNEGTVTRTWRGRDRTGRITAPQLEDLRAWVDLSVQNFVLARSGVQELLEPMD